jgi:hypothetical protein
MSARRWLMITLFTASGPGSIGAATAQRRQRPGTEQIRILDAVTPPRPPANASAGYRQLIFLEAVASGSGSIGLRQRMRLNITLRSGHRPVAPIPATRRPKSAELIAGRRFPVLPACTSGGYGAIKMIG